MANATSEKRARPLVLAPAMRSAPDQISADTAREIERFTPELRSLARSLSPSWSAADDLVQETLLQIWGIHDSPIGAQTLHDRARAILRAKAAARAMTRQGGAGRVA
ncbi:MAG: sigma factor [Pseudomonadota bacterium]